MLSKDFKIQEKNMISVVLHIKERPAQLSTFIPFLETYFSNGFEHYEYVLVNNSKEVSMAPFLEGISIKGEVNMVNLAWQHNIENAMSAGIDMAIGDFIFEFDSMHINYDIDLLDQVYKKCLAGNDTVSACPEKNNKNSSKYFYYLLNKLSYKNIQLQTETFRIVSRRMINRTNTEKSTFRYRKANYHGSGLQTAIVPYSANDNTKAEKEYSLWEQISLASNILIYYSSVGTKLSTVLSVVFFIISLSVGLYAIVSYLVLKNDIQEGWTTTMLFLSIGFAGLFAILAVLSKYMEVLLKSTHIKQQYTYKSVNKLNKN